MSHYNAEPPKEILDDPTLQLVWQGLSVSIAGRHGLTRKQAIEILRGLPTDEDPDDEPSIAA